MHHVCKFTLKQGLTDLGNLVLGPVFLLIVISLLFAELRMPFLSGFATVIALFVVMCILGVSAGKRRYNVQSLLLLLAIDHRP